MLQFQDTFIIDNNLNGIWVWIGRKSTKQERVGAFRIAEQFIKQKNYPNHIFITRVIDGGEPIEFKALFKHWKDQEESDGFGNSYKVERIAKTSYDKINFSSIHNNNILSSQTQLIDNGKGKKEVYRVKNFDIELLDEKDHGKFYSGDCYIIVYTNALNKIMIYYWIGLKSSVDEKGTAAMKVVDMDNNLYSGHAVQVRVVERKEPPHFMALFRGEMVIFQGGYASGFKNHHDDQHNHQENYLLQIRGTNNYNTKAIEVDCKASSLNSNDVFILNTQNEIYIWIGKVNIK